MKNLRLFPLLVSQEEIYKIFLQKNYDSSPLWSARAIFNKFLKKSLRSFLFFVCHHEIHEKTITENLQYYFFMVKQEDKRHYVFFFVRKGLIHKKYMKNLRYFRFFSIQEEIHANTITENLQSYSLIFKRQGIHKNILHNT